jgi:hypothetical protein
MSSEYYQVSECFRHPGLREDDMNVIDQPELYNIKDYLEKVLRIGISDLAVDSLSDTTEKNQSVIYRFSLLSDANTEKYQQFKQNIEWIKSNNPSWEILPDMPKLEKESEAWIMIYKDENYWNRRISHLVITSLSGALLETYGK